VASDCVYMFQNDLLLRKYCFNDIQLNHQQLKKIAFSAHISYLTYIKHITDTYFSFFIFYYTYFYAINSSIHITVKICDNSSSRS